MTHHQDQAIQRGELLWEGSTSLLVQVLALGHTVKVPREVRIDHYPVMLMVMSTLNSVSTRYLERSGRVRTNTTGAKPKVQEQMCAAASA